MERRSGPRVHYPVPVKVWGSEFKFETAVDDLGTGGIRLRAPREIGVGEKLWVSVDFSLGRQIEPRVGKLPSVSARGIVIRVRDLQDGMFELAAKFTHYLCL